MNRPATPMFKLAYEAVGYELELKAEQQQLLALKGNQEFLKELSRPQLILLLLTIELSYREGNYSRLQFQLLRQNIRSRINELS